MLHLGSIYLFVKNMEESVEFYKKLLSMEPTARAYDRWAQFNFEGRCIALYNNEYDKKFIDSNDNLDKHYNAGYIEYYEQRKIIYGNTAVLNFWTEDLSEEYERIKALNIGTVSKILYVNISSSYYFFTIIDPNGNTVEITRAYSKN